MPKPKRPAKPTAKPSTSTAFPTSSIPPPFVPAPPTLQAFLATLDHNHVYLTSLDRHDRDFKRRIFAVPLLLNIFLTILILYRLQFAIPYYLTIFASLLGYDTPAKILGYDTPVKIDVKNTDSLTLLGLGGERALRFLGDLILFRFVGMWPWAFFLGQSGLASPVGWRRWVGFRDVEIVVRRSRRWDIPLFMKEDGSEEFLDGVKEEWLEQGKEGQVWRERVEPAVERQWLRNKTSYMMLDKSWDLFFQGMLKAHALVDEEQNKLEDFRTSLLVYSEDLGWLMWEAWKEHEDGTEDEGTRKLQLIKDKLTKMGKENLFFRWIEVVQSETSQPGPFTVQKQKKAIEKIRGEFEAQRIDFDEFWEDVGGVGSMPGMEVTGKS
ncbi:hypothetical protein P7C71_g1633, partial [Lecanoromycetidae sp. Uapishka_2]